MAPVADRHDVWGKGVCTLNLKFYLASCERTLMSPGLEWVQRRYAVGDNSSRRCRGRTVEGRDIVAAGDVKRIRGIRGSRRRAGLSRGFIRSTRVSGDGRLCDTKRLTYNFIALS